MPTQRELDKLYMDFAFRVAKMSKAVRRKVGAVLVKDNAVISYGYNGTPSGDDNTCEIEDENGKLITKDSVIHAEMNAILKPLNSGISTEGSIMYITDAPCIHCAKHLAQFGAISALVYARVYKSEEGAQLLLSKKINVRRLSKQMQGDSEVYEYPEHDGYVEEVNTDKVSNVNDVATANGVVVKGQTWENLNKKLHSHKQTCTTLSPVQNFKDLPKLTPLQDMHGLIVANGEFRNEKVACFCLFYRNMWYAFPIRD